MIKIINENLFQKEKNKLSLFLQILLFSYFFSLHADQLGCFFYGFNIRLNNLLAFVLGCCVLYVLKGNIVFSKKMIVSLLTLIFSVMISCLVNPISFRSIIFLFWFVFSLIFYFIIPVVLVRNFSLKKVISLYFLSFLFIGLYSVVQWLVSYFGLIDPFISQFVGNIIARPNAFAYEPSFYVLCITPFVSIILFSNILSSVLGVSDFFFKQNWFLFFLSNFFILISMTTSSLLFYFIFFILVFFFSLFLNFFNWKKFFLKISILSLSLIFILNFLPYNISFFFLKFFLLPLNSLESFSDRFSGIKVCLKIWLEHPFFGIGLGNIPSYCYQEFILGNKEMLYRCESFIKEENILKVFEPSNVLTELLASLGIIGFISFVFFFANIWRFFLFSFKKTSFFSTNLIVSVILMMCLLQINQGLLRSYIWVHIGIVFGILELISKGELITKQPCIVS